jgi:Lar family restriction alleviation protein
MTDYQAQYKILKKKIEVLDKSILTGIAKEVQRSDLAYQIRVLKEKANDEGTPLLDPCPFCGSVDIEMKDTEIAHYALCVSCEAEGPANTVLSSAIAKWNQRSD